MLQSFTLVRLTLTTCTFTHLQKVLQAFITPKTSCSFVINYKFGRVKEFSETITPARKISANIAYSFLDYNG